MSEQAHSTEAPEHHFTSDDLVQFDADDTEVGKVIGKMLSLLFIYTVVAMSIVGVWTWMK